MQVGNLIVSPDPIHAFCVKWHLDASSVFGGALRDDFRPDSDVGVVIHFSPGAVMGLDAMIDTRAEFSAMFGGPEIDLVERQLVTHPYRRHEILTNRWQ